MTSRLALMQAKYQQKQMKEKEEKLLKLYENQQQRTIERIGKGSAGSDGIITTTTATANTIMQGGKVRQMFDERRQKAGIDRSYPLEPLKSKRNGETRLILDKGKNVTGKIVLKSTMQKASEVIKNGKLAVNKKEVMETVYVNKVNNENIEEQLYNNENYAEIGIKQDDDLVKLMNNHNLNDDIDNEEMPNVELDDIALPIITGKLTNVGGKLPSQNELNQTLQQKTTPLTNKKSVVTQTQHKKPLAQKSVSKPQASPKRISSEGLKSSTHSNISARNPSILSKANMSAKKAQDRVPSTNKPSAKQVPRAPASAVTRDDLATCKFCNRRFAPDRLQIHEEICARTGKKKRKTYDAMKHRVQGTEIEPFIRKSNKQAIKATKSTNGKKSNWRQTHNDFVSTIRAAKMAQAHIAKGGKLSDLPPPPVSTNPDYVQCPHCGRRFNEAAAARHIPKCATYEFNKPKSNQPSKPSQRIQGRGSFR